MTRDVAAVRPLLMLIPEFPGQTHNFFWQQIHELEQRGQPVVLAATRPPPARLQSPSWAAEAKARTTYLLPIRRAHLPGLLMTLLRAGPLGVGRCLRTVALADTSGLLPRLRLLALAAVALQLVRIVRNTGARHVHVHSCADAANLALFCRHLAGVGYSLTLHGGLGGYGPNQRAKWSHAAFGVTVTETLRRELVAALGNALPPAVLVAPMGIDATFFRRTSPYRPWRAGERLQLFSCGRLNRYKGHETALALLAQLAADGVDVHLKIAGEDDRGGMGYRSELEAAIAAADLQPRVTLLGAVAATEVRAQLQQAHVFILLSQDEALGVAYMEAMAMEVPVLGARIGGVAELIEEGVEGHLVPPTDTCAALTALRRILADPQRAEALGQAGRRKVVEQFSAQRSALALLGQLAAA